MPSRYATALTTRSSAAHLVAMTVLAACVCIQAGDVSFAPITISGQYNAFTHADSTPGWFESPGTPADLTNMPVGSRTYGGMAWSLASSHEVPAAIMTSGSGSDISDAVVGGIMVNDIVDGFACLHTFHEATAIDAGQHVFSYVVVFAEGDSIEIPMYWGEHVQGWFRTESFSSVVSHERLRIGWKESVSSSETVVAYYAHWYLPVVNRTVREVAIKAIDSSLGTPALLAITAVHDQTVDAWGLTWGYRDFNWLDSRAFIVGDNTAGSLSVPYHGDNHHSQLAFVRTPVHGDFTFTAGLESFSFGGDWNFLGLSARDTPLQYGGGKFGTQHVTLNFRTSGEVQLTDGHSVGGVKGSLTAPAPVWMRLERSGSTFTGRMSASGDDGTWQTVAQVTKPLNDTIYLGFNCSSAHTQSMNTVVFTDVSFEADFSPTAIATRTYSPACAKESASPKMMFDLRGRARCAPLGPSAASLLFSHNGALVTSLRRAGVSVVADGVSEHIIDPSE